jgi:glycosyltransferase involved in cell wall biosynthesis
VVTTPNQYLADYARKWSSAVEIIPMAIDLDRWHPPEGKKTINRPIVIGWAGAPVNIPLLESLNPILMELVNKNKFLKIAVFSGQRPRLDVPYEYYPFEPGKESEFIQKLDIGLLPLRKDEFSMGKSPIKAIQYLACGVPVVGNVFGATAEILNERNSVAVNTPDEWIEGLQRLIVSPALIKNMGEAGRKHVEVNHDLCKVREKFLRILCAA